MDAERFPGTNDQIPVLLTPREAIKLLRLDIVTNGDGEERVRAPADALRSLRRIAGLTPRNFGRSFTYARSDLLKLIERQDE